MPYKNKKDRVKNSRDYYYLNKDKIKAYIRSWKQKNKGRIAIYARKSNKKRKDSGDAANYYAKNSEKIKETSRINGAHFRKRFPEKAKDQTLRKKYGITLEQYNEKLKLQKGMCAACGLILDEKCVKNKPQVDHCHYTGIFRGILCRTCNIVEGFLEKKSDVILMVIKYKENL